MRIQCPECSQRFDVTEDFLGKTVECGSCDGRFKVSMDEVVKEKEKFYPGEKRDSHLERFGRSAHEGAANVEFAQAHYQPNVNFDQVGPPRPRRTVAMMSGIALMSLIIIVFLLAGGKEGAMRDMETMNRFILCGFSALVGGLLVIYGTAHNRKLGVLLTLVFAAILLALPVLFPGNPTSASTEPIVLIDGGGEDNTSAQATRIKDDYLFEIGYEPVSDAIAKHPKESVVGIFIRSASETVREKIASFLYEATDKVSRETLYRRGESGEDGLVLLVEQKMTIDEIAALCTKFGRIEKIDKELRIIDIAVETAKIASLDKYKVLDSESLDFEAQNLKALKSFDPREQMDAVKRLAGAKPRALRDDITQELLKMLPLSKADLQLEIINALKVWALPDSGAGPIVLEAVKELHLQGKVSKTSMELLIAHQVDGADTILMELWHKDPVKWSDVLLQLGSGAEVLLLPKVKEMDVAHVTAASDIIGKVGTEAGIEFLEGIMPDLDEHRKKSLQAAIDEIKKRQ
ncbi:MAG: hypothetical protein H7A51_18325 [Akkermansiaceae bacterium]|nr:hypothetical protein [Akkermansiaceae bacterium]